MTVLYETEKDPFLIQGVQRDSSFFLIEFEKYNDEFQESNISIYKTEGELKENYSKRIKEIEQILRGC